MAAKNGPLSVSRNGGASESEVVPPPPTMMSATWMKVVTFSSKNGTKRILWLTATTMMTWREGKILPQMQNQLGSYRKKKTKLLAKSKGTTMALLITARKVTSTMAISPCGTHSTGRSSNGSHRDRPQPPRHPGPPGSPAPFRLMTMMVVTVVMGWTLAMGSSQPPMRPPRHPGPLSSPTMMVVTMVMGWTLVMMMAMMAG